MTSVSLPPYSSFSLSARSGKRQALGLRAVVTAVLHAAEKADGETCSEAARAGCFEPRGRIIGGSMIRLRPLLQKATVVASMLYVLSLIPAAHAGLITTAFGVVNTNADGSIINPSVLFPGDSSSFDLTGGNNGDGLEGQTTYIATALSAFIVQFQWSYTSCFPPNEQPPSDACDSPGYDWTGYLVNQTLTLLTDTDTGGVAGSASFAVSSLSVFGWYVGTLDNEGEPGTLTVSDVSFTPVNSDVPEPGTLALCTTCIVALAAARRSIVNTRFQKRRKA